MLLPDGALQGATTASGGHLHPLVIVTATLPNEPRVLVTRGQPLCPIQFPARPMARPRKGARAITMPLARRRSSPKPAQNIGCGLVYSVHVRSTLGTPPAMLLRPLVFPKTLVAADGHWIRRMPARRPSRSPLPSDQCLPYSIGSKLPLASTSALLDVADSELPVEIPPAWSELGK